MKAKKNKKLMKEHISDCAVMIKCKYCDSNKTCMRKDRKVRDERKGIRTFCLLTENKSKKTLKKVSSKVYKE